MYSVLAYVAFGTISSTAIIAIKVNNKILDTQYIQANLDIEKINIEGYSKFYLVHANKRSVDINIKEAFKSVNLETGNLEYSIEANLTSQFEKYVNIYISTGVNEMQQYFKENNENTIIKAKDVLGLNTENIKNFYLRI